MIKKKEEPNFSDVFNRLAGLNNKPSKTENKNVILKETFNNGVTYAVVKEGLKYLIKESLDGTTQENSLEYIGGLAQKGKYKYRYNNHLDAEKSFVLFKKSINESFIDERREDDIEPEQAPGEEGALNFDLGNQAPQAEPAPVEPSAEVPAPEAPQAEPEVAPAPVGGEEVPAEDGISDAELDAEINSDGEEENIDHYVGKLTAALRDTDATQLTDGKVKSVLNSIIAALPLSVMSPEDRLKIARRIRKGDGVEEMDIPNEMISESQILHEKKIKEGENTHERCQAILDLLNKGQHKSAKELFGKLKNSESFYNYLDGLDFPNEMIEGYRKYFSMEPVQSDAELAETDEEPNDEASAEVDAIEAEPEVPADVEEPLTVNDSPNENDDDIFRNFIMKLAVSKDVGVVKDIAEPDSFVINGYKFKPTTGENGFVTISVSKDELTKMDFILTDEYYETEFKALLNTTEEV